MTYRNLLQQPRAQAGFTLIEITLVMAISSLLLVGVLRGFSTLQSRARFDTAVDQTIQNIAYARNFAQSNVNTEGPGDHSDTLIAGTSMEFDNGHFNHGYPLEELQPIYANPDADGNPDPTTYAEMPGGGSSNCNPADHPDDDDECWEQFMTLNDPLKFDDPGMAIGLLVYINTSRGIQFCHQESGSFVSVATACSTPATTPFDFQVADDAGYSATIQVDPVSGYARRLN